jgi:hypothetical protein
MTSYDMNNKQVVSRAHTREQDMKSISGMMYKILARQEYE